MCRRCSHSIIRRTWSSGAWRMNELVVLKTDMLPATSDHCASCWNKSRKSGLCHLLGSTPPASQIWVAMQGCPAVAASRRPLTHLGNRRQFTRPDVGGRSSYIGSHSGYCCLVQPNRRDSAHQKYPGFIMLQSSLFFCVNAAVHDRLHRPIVNSRGVQEQLWSTLTGAGLLGWLGTEPSIDLERMSCP